MAVPIRRALLEESDEVARLHRLSRETALPFLPVLHTAEEDRKFFRERVFPTCEVWVAEDVGLVGVIAFRKEWIDHLYIHPARQRLGCGRAPLGEAKARNHRLELWTFQRNRNAIAFYKANGFHLARKTDGAANEEREPDALYAWSR